jgi:hypothetical protein
MTIDRAIECLYRFHAWDVGDTDAGLHDQALRREIEQFIDSLDERVLRVALGRSLRKRYLSDEALEQGYGPEDVGSFCRWLYDGDYRA